MGRLKKIIKKAPVPKVQELHPERNLYGPPNSSIFSALIYRVYFPESKFCFEFENLSYKLQITKRFWFHLKYKKKTWDRQIDFQVFFRTAL